MGWLVGVCLPGPDHRHRGRAAGPRIVVAIGMGVGGVYVWVNSKAKKRMSLLEEQLPDAVELMVRSLARRPSVFVRHRHRRQGNP